MMRSSLALAFILALCASSSSFAQDTFWELVKQPSDSPIVGIEQTSSGGMHLAVAADGEAFKSTDGGTTWSSASTDLADALCIKRHPTLSGILLVGTSSGISQTANGVKWASIGLSGRRVQSISGLSSGWLYAGTSTGAFLSSNGGNTWESHNSGLGATNIRSTSTTGSDWLYAGTSNGLYIYASGEPAWVASGLGNVNVYSVYSHGSTGAVYAGSNNGLYSTGTWGTGSWTKRVTTTSPVTAILRSDKSIIAGSENSVHYSADGSSYQQVSGGLASPGMTALGLVSQDRRVLLGARDGSIYRSIKPIASLLSSEESSGEHQPWFSPNPASSHVQLQGVAPGENIEVTIYDVTGRRVLTAKTESRIDLTSLAPGVYEVELSGSAPKRLVIVR